MSFPIGRLMFFDPGAWGAVRQRMVSSWELRGPKRPDDSPYSRFMDKCVQIEPAERLTLLDQAGPGVLARLYFTLPTRWRPHLLRRLALHIEVDGVRTLSAPLGDLFALPFGRYRTFASFYVACLSGGYALRLPIPYRQRINISLANDDRLPAPLVFFQANLFDCPDLPADAPTLCGHWRRSNPTRPGEPHVLLDAACSGWYVGSHLNAQMIEPFPSRPLWRLAFPLGYGLGNLEGWERIYVDDEPSPSFHGTGHEELFDSGWYFTRPFQVAPFAGVLERSYLKGRACVFRHHATDPIPFRRSLRFELDHGIDNQVAGDYSSLALFYAHPPYPQAPDLPSLPARLPTSWLPHALNFAAALPLIPWAVAASAPRLLGFLKRAGYDLRRFRG